MFTSLHRSGVAALLLGWAAPRADAQYYPPGAGYGSVLPGVGRGATLSGSANVMSAYGQLGLQQEQARIEREKANQAKLDTNKKTLDMRNYEREHTRTFTENQANDAAWLLRRVMKSPTETEIKTGKAANLMLPYLRGLVDRGIAGPPVPLDQGLLKQVNVTTGSGDSGLGVLKHGGEVDWPLVLQGPTQQKLAEVLPQAVSATVNGTLSPGLFRQATKGVEALKDELKKQFYAEKIDGGDYLTGKRFLASLEGSVRMLSQPNAAKLLNGSFAARGQTVDELVVNMSRQGLLFAPASPDGEPAYRSLHDAMAGYAAGAQNSPGFRNQASAPPFGSFKGPR